MTSQGHVEHRRRMTSNVNPALLSVDDEPRALEGLTLHLRRAFTATPAPAKSS
jgi:hypothetical protein